MKNLCHCQRQFERYGLFMLKRLLTLLLVSMNAYGTEDVLSPKQIKWSFDGALGTVDRQAAQRGFQVYKEVCSACHSMSHLSYRNLENLGFSALEVKEIASGYSVKDGPNDNGEMFERPGNPSDKFVNPYENEQAARASNGGAYPVDLSLIVKARADGANYIYSLLTGYNVAPNGVELQAGQYYNPYFPGKKIAMPQPLSHDQVQYMDGTPSTVEQMSHDVVAFLQWAAEPEMEARKSMGLKVMMYLAVFTVVFYIVKKKIWARLK